VIAAVDVVDVLDDFFAALVLDVGIDIGRSARSRTGSARTAGPCGPDRTAVTPRQ